MTSKKIIPVITVVYKSKDGNWRGFCFPYDVSCTAETKEEAGSILEGLVETYEEVLNKYNNPSHLIDKELSDEEDQKALAELWPEIRKDLAKRINAARTPKEYQTSGTLEFGNKIQAVAQYSSRGVLSPLGV